MLSYSQVNESLTVIDVLAYCQYDPSYADGRHHLDPCGAVKGRISNPKTGAGGCDGCGASWGDKVGLASHLLGISNCEAKNRLANRYGIRDDSPPIVRRPSEKKQLSLPPEAITDDGYSAHDQFLKLTGWNAANMQSVIHRKAGTSEAAWRAVGTETGFWKASPKSKTLDLVAAIPIYGCHGLTKCNHMMHSVMSKGIRVRTSDGYGNWIETTTMRRLAFGQLRDLRDSGFEFDRNGVFLTLADRKLILRGEPIPELRCIHTEGEPDMLALESTVPSETPLIVWSNNDGARSTHVAKWFLPMLAKLEPVEHIIIPDRDKAGVEGAAKLAAVLSRQAPVRVVELPLPYTEKKGADLRDWFAAGEKGFVDLQRLIDMAQVIPMDLSSEPSDDASKPAELSAMHTEVNHESF